MLAHRFRRRANIKPALVQHLVSAARSSLAQWAPGSTASNSLIIAHHRVNSSLPVRRDKPLPDGNSGNSSKRLPLCKR